MTTTSAAPDLADRDTLLEQIHALSERRLDPAAAASLKHRLSTDEDARRLYIHTLDLSAQLKWRYAQADAAAPPSTEPRAASLPAPAAARDGSWLGWAWAAAVAALVTIAGALVAVRSMHNPSIAPPPVQSVAVLIDANDVIWASEPRSIGDDLPPQRVAIDAGSLELILRSGVEVDLSGHTSMHIASPQLAQLARGLLTARVPHGVVGFTVDLPDGSRIVDLGTAFTVNTLGDDRFGLYVSEGSVALHRPDGGAAVFTAGHLIGIDTAGRVAPVAALSPLLATHWADPEAIRPLIDRLLERDPIVAAHATFPDGDAPGRFDDTSAPSFDSLDARRPLPLNGRFDRLTLAAWVKLDASTAPLRVLLISDDWGPAGHLSWDIRNGDSLCLAVSGNGNPHYHATHVLDPSHLGRWTHLALVYDADRAVVEHYVDGARVSSEPITRPMSLEPGPAGIGAWKVDAPRPLAGSIDELTVIADALSAQQINALWRIGKTEESQPEDEGDPR